MYLNSIFPGIFPLHLEVTDNVFHGKIIVGGGFNNKKHFENMVITKTRLQAYSKNVFYGYNKKYCPFTALTTKYIVNFFSGFCHYAKATVKSGLKTTKSFLCQNI